MHDAAEEKKGFVLKVALEMSSASSLGRGCQVNGSTLEQVILASLTRFFGQVGASAPFVVDECESLSEHITTFVVDCESQEHVALIRAALTMQSEYQRQTCAFHVLKVGDSRDSLSNAEVLINLQML